MSSYVLVTLRDLSVKADFLGLIGTYKKNQDALITQGMYALALSKEIYAPYLVYYSNSPGYRAHVKRNKIGSTQVHLRNGQFLDIKIPLPEVEQQKRIVAKTEELFSHIDAGIEALKKAKQLLKQYRQSVLKAGFSGVLTSEATNGEELPIGWKKIELGKISTDVSYGYTASSSKDAIGPKMLRITDIQDNKVIWDDVPYCEIAESAVSKYLLDTNDIVFARTGATVGKSFLIEGEIPCSVYASYLIRVRLKENIDPKYISLFFHTSDYWYQIKKNQSGIGQPNVNGTKLKKLAVTLAPYESQKKIVSIIEEKLSSIEHLESEIDQQLIKAERNKQAVLASAFSGNLMETEA